MPKWSHPQVGTFVCEKTLVITSSHWNQMEMERGKKKKNTWKVTMVQLVCISSLGSRFRCVAWAIFQLWLELKLQVAGSSILPKHNYSAGSVIHGNTHTIHAWYIIPSWMVDFYGFHVGKYTILPWILWDMFNNLMKPRKPTTAQINGPRILLSP